jgi:opacity protein-like surface antigen
MPAGGPDWRRQIRTWGAKSPNRQIDKSSNRQIAKFLTVEHAAPPGYAGVVRLGSRHSEGSVKRTVALLACLAVAAAGLLSAQERPVALTAVGGATLPVQDARGAMGPGWNVGVAGSVKVAPALELRGDYLYSRFGAQTARWDVTLGPLLPAFQTVTVRAKSQMHTVSLDLAWIRPIGGGARVYLLGGPSVFHRRVQITGTGPSGTTTGCEPPWLQCAAQPVAFDRALGIKTANDLGFNVGAGVAFEAGLNALVTIEARYVSVRGDALRSADGRSLDASAQFLPISIGLRF